VSISKSFFWLYLVKGFFCWLLNKLAVLSKIIFILCLLACCLPVVSAPVALSLGLVLAFSLGNPFAEISAKYSSQLLRASVIGLGFGIHFQVLFEAGKNSLFFTIAWVVGVLVSGLFLGKILKNDDKITWLISSGTAICGGSAVAAVGTAIDANSRQISVATGTVFLLNAVALLVFPVVGSWLGMSQTEFGTWAAVAIHDTSSVVGAAAKFGDQALEIATTTKLVRVLWIIPMTFVAAFPYWRRGLKVQFPYFILLFILASLMVSYLPEYESSFKVLYRIARQALVVSLFLIGASLSLNALKEVGFKTLLQGIILWVLGSVVSAIFVLSF
jgi:uncharacterized integral membrane protein (TIGR00698 family)